MGASVMAIIFASGLGEAFYHQLVNVGIRTTTGHLQIYPKGWDFDIMNPMSGNIPKLKYTKGLENIILNTPFIKSFGKEIIYQVLLYDSSDDYYYASIVGAEPEKIKQTIPGLKLIKGTDLAEGLRKGILISVDMANYFKNPFKENDKMYIITGGTNGMMEGIKTSYQGIVESMPFFADRVAFVSIDKIQKLIGWEKNEFCSIKIFLQNKNKADESAVWLKEQLKKRGLNLEVKTWKELGGFYYHIALLGRVLVFILLIIIAAISAITVSNTMLISVKERTREIGTIKALGLKKKDILRIFLFESFTLSLISTFSGALLGSLITFFFEHRGIIEGIDLVLERKLFPILGIVPVAFSIIWILFIGTLSGFYPALKAANLNPIEALRHL